mgnify:CR=1 FL=1
MITRVRVATSKDARTIAEIHVASWQEGYRGQLPDGFLKSLSVDARQARWAQSLRDGAGVLLAEQAGEAVGFVMFGPSRDDDAPANCAEIWALYVHPGAWSSGAGRKVPAGARVALAAERSTADTPWGTSSTDRARRSHARLGRPLAGAGRAGHPRPAPGGGNEVPSVRRAR